MVPGGLNEGRVCRDSLGDGSWTASTSALVSAKVRRKPGGGERREVRSENVALRHHPYAGPGESSRDVGKIPGAFLRPR